MGRKRTTNAPRQTAPVATKAAAATKAAVPPIDPNSGKVIDSFMNSFADAVGIGGGINPQGYPFNQYAPGTATVENVGTIFKNLRWYMVSNMRQVLNQAYVEFGLVQTIIDVPVDDALRGGVNIKTSQLEESQIEDLKASLDRDDDLNTAGQAAKWNRLFGGAGILILTDQDPEEPLELEQIGKDDPLEFRAVDMWELFWDKQNTEGYDPTIQEENFEYYNYYGEQVHKSRVMRLKGLTAPSFIRPRLRGWGFSVVEILVRSINQYLKSTDLAFEVLDEFKVDVYKIAGLTQALASPQGVEAIKKRVQLANWEKNYNNALTMDKEDDWDHKQLSFTGLGEAMMQIRMQVAADMRMPLTKLFGISAAGFNSGEDDIEVYNAMVEAQVRNKIKYPILRILEIKCQQMFGFIPDDLSITFEPLRYMSSEQEETVKTQQFARLLQAMQAGAITLSEFRNGINKGELFDITLDTDEDDLLTGYMADQVGDDDTDPESDVEGDDNPGVERVDTARPTAGSKGGVPVAGPVKDQNKGNQPAPRAKPSKPAKEFDESKVKRADDGKFGSGGAGGWAKKLKEKHPALSGTAVHSGGENKADATAKAKQLRADGIHATIWHVDGPKSGPKSVYVVGVPESTKNSIVLMPQPWTTADRARRAVANSPIFDKKSYEAHGGDAWIDERRKHFFDRDKAQDKSLWDRAAHASRDALGVERWQFIVWFYKKYGGSFSQVMNDRIENPGDVDEALWDKAKKISMKEYGEHRWAFVSSIYKKLGGKFHRKGQ